MLVGRDPGRDPQRERGDDEEEDEQDPGVPRERLEEEEDAPAEGGGGGLEMAKTKLCAKAKNGNEEAKSKILATDILRETNV